MRLGDPLIDNRIEATARGDWMAHLYTIGHSTRSPEEFIKLLRQNDVRILVDVRSWPSSRRYPHFNRYNLARTLEQNGVRYEWLGEQVGGYRKKGLGEESANKGWRSPSETMQTTPSRNSSERV